MSCEGVLVSRSFAEGRSRLPIDSTMGVRGDSLYCTFDLTAGSWSSPLSSPPPSRARVLPFHSRNLNVYIVMEIDLPTAPFCPTQQPLA
mgnify:CR=1 FL=1